MIVWKPWVAKPTQPRKWLVKHQKSTCTHNSSLIAWGLLQPSTVVPYKFREILTQFNGNNEKLFPSGKFGSCYLILISLKFLNTFLNRTLYEGVLHTISNRQSDTLHSKRYILLFSDDFRTHGCFVWIANTLYKKKSCCLTALMATSCA